MIIKRYLLKLQDFYLFSVKAPLALFRRPFYLRETIEQMDYAGAGSFFIVVIVSLFIGMAMSLQISAELASLGLKMYTGKIVGMAIIREIGPVAVAIAFAGRVGSGMASELGSMVLSSQVDVIRVFGIDPVKKLVTPRVLSSIIMLPALTVIGDIVSLLGGYYIAVFVSHQSGSFYWGQIREIMDFKNIFSGVVKPFMFGYIISCVSCYMGFSAGGGARGLRVATTRAVVTSIVLIIVTDFILTKILLYLLGFNV